MLINDKSQLKRNVEQIGFSLHLKLARVSAQTLVRYFQPRTLTAIKLFLVTWLTF